MIHTAALASGLASLGVVLALYACHVMSPRGSWVRGEVPQSILLSLLTGLFPLALGTSLTGLWLAVSEGLALSSVLEAGTDLVSLGAVLATIAMLRITLVAKARFPRWLAVMFALGLAAFAVFMVGSMISLVLR